VSSCRSQGAKIGSRRGVPQAERLLGPGKKRGPAREREKRKRISGTVGDSPVEDPTGREAGWREQEGKKRVKFSTFANPDPEREGRSGTRKIERDKWGGPGMFGKNS